MREAQEESGLTEFDFVDLRAILLPDTPQALFPYNLDYHLIPASMKEPAHYHYDVSFLLTTDDTTPLQITSESKDLRWFDLEEAKQLIAERSLQQQLQKLHLFKKQQQQISVAQQGERDIYR